MDKENEVRMKYQQICQENLRNLNHFSVNPSLAGVAKVILYDVITFFSPGA